ncbi:MAG: GrpB family protein [Thermoleophilia bacterium]|nr:GrpB family protein [Thermoleophilia bacterium]
MDDTHLDRVLIGGRERRAIVIADYDPAWPERFAVERARIASALGERALRIEHIGSTSVPGLAAKPIVDILVEVAALEHAAGLERAGYVLRVREDGHRMYRTPEIDVNVHAWPAGSPSIATDLAFRDRLRASPEDRAAYEALKRELAARDWPDVNRYAEAKGPLIREILARAATG